MLLEIFKPFYFVCGLGGLAFGFIGQMQLEAGQLGQGAVFFVIGVVLTVAAYRKLPGLNTQLAVYQPASNSEWTQWGYYTAGLGLIFAALAFWLFTRVNTPMLLPWLLYLTSIVFFILAIFWLV